MLIKPYSNNIIFFDTEFTDLNARTGELLSIGLIKYIGLGHSPNSMGKHEFFKSLGIDKEKYTEHNALTDARLLKDAYMKFYEVVK